MSENKAYFAVIPANVRYSTEISNGAKLLYAEITALSNERGYCWASNDYFAGLYNTSPRTISRWLAELGREGFIYSLVDNAKGNTRQIWLPEMAASHAKNVNSLTTKMSIGIDKNVARSRQKRREGMDKNVIHNTTVNNKENTTVNVSADAPNERAETAALEEEKKSPPPIPPAPLPAATARAKDADEAEAIIRAWANGEGRDTVTNWISQALYSEKTHGPVRDEIAKFVGHYATADEYKIFHDPIKFFRNRFKAWLIQAKTYNKPAASNPAPTTTYSKPRFLEL